MLLFIFLLHLIADYVFQSETMAKKKEDEGIGLIFHLFVYALVMLIIPLLFKNSFVLTVLLILAHTIIDIVFYFIKRKTTNEDGLLTPFVTYLLDQILHIVSILLIVYCYQGLLHELQYTKVAGNILSVLHYYGMNGTKFVQISFLFVVLHKPTNIFITKFLGTFSLDKEDASSKENENKNDKDNDIKAGRYIGTLERLIVVILIYIKQYTAIAWVLTAKSITRHESIREHKISGEYFLLGTLMSLLVVIVISFIVFHA